jgi:MinD superfamily P-loop ATPase
VTAADGAANHYQTGKGTPRVETPEESIKIDYSLREAYKQHPRHVLIDNSTGIQGKVYRAITAIEQIISETSP